MPDGYTVTPWRGRERLGCDACEGRWGTTMLSEMQQHLKDVHGVRPRRRAAPAAGPAPALDGIDFASDEAAELAIREGVTAEQLRAREPSGKKGFTVADVRAARTATE